MNYLKIPIFLKKFFKNFVFAILIEHSYIKGGHFDNIGIRAMQK